MKEYIDANSDTGDELIYEGLRIPESQLERNQRPARPTLYTAVYWWFGCGSAKSEWTCLESSHTTAQAAYDDAAATPELIDVDSIKIFKLPA